MISVELNARGPTDMFKGEKHVLRPAIRSGALSMFDLRQSWSADVRDPFDNVNIFVPLESFDQLAWERGLHLHELRCQLEAHVHDRVMLNFARIMTVLLSKPPHEIDVLMLDCLFEACREYLFSTYGVVSHRKELTGRALGASATDNLMAFIDANLENGVRLADLAAQCGLSTSSVVRAFRTTLRTSPHQWVMQRRIEKAQSLLRIGSLPHSQIALACGFTDQSHFIRVFTAKVGTSPGKWQQIART